MKSISLNIYCDEIVNVVLDDIFSEQNEYWTYLGLLHVPVHKQDDLLKELLNSALFYPLGHNLLERGGNLMSKKQKWQYRLVTVKVNRSDPAENVDKLNKLGKKGWKVAGITPLGSNSRSAVVLMEKPR